VLLELARRVDQVCTAFEAAWKAGQRPRLEDYLPAGPEAERAAILRELVPLEAEYRRRTGEQPQAEEYQRRFPGLDPTWVAAAVAPPPTLLEPRAVDSCHVAAPATGDATPRAGAAAESAEAGSAVGRVAVPGYEVLGELGRGGMGVVYRARQLKLNRLVALKMILAGAHAGAEELARFITEAEAVARLQHPNIVQIYEVGEHERLPYFSLEFCAGGSLAARLNGTPLPPGEAAQLVEALAHAMHAAHQAGVIHRDLKPANILLAFSGRSASGAGDAPHAVRPLSEAVPRITDFGLAKRLDVAAPGWTRSSAILGTPSYMAPEQAAGRTKEMGPATDVYALGAILYECLTGRPPFKAATPLDTMFQVIGDEPVPPALLQPGVPRDLETLCLKCLEKEPARRYPTAQDLAEDLRRFGAGEPVRARPVSGLERGLRWARRHPAATGLVAASAVALLALVGLAVAGYYTTWLNDARFQLESALRSADEQRQHAESAKAEAEKAEGEAKAARAGEEAQRERADGLLYLMRIERAHSAWRENDVGRADDILEACTPQQRSNWEWRYLHRLCHFELLTFKGHSGGVCCVAWSPDGTRLASSSEDRTVKVWDAETGQHALTLRGHTDEVWGVTWSPDGMRLASTSGPFHGHGEVKVWDARTAQEALSLQGHWGRVYGVAWSPDGTRLASSSEDRTVKVWDAKTGQEALSLKGHTGGVHGVAWSPDGSRLASASADQTVKIWDAKTGQEALTLKGHTDEVRGVAWSPDGRRLASASADQTVKIWDAKTGQEALTLKGHRGGVSGVAWSPEGTRLATGGRDLMVMGSILKEDHTVKVWDTHTGQEALSIWGHTGAVNGLSWNPDGRRLASASQDGTVKVWEATTVQEALTLKGHTRLVEGVAWSPDGTRLASASADWTVKVWDAQSGEAALTLQGGTGPVASVAWSPDSARLASAGGWTVKVWDARTGQEGLSLEGHAGPVRGVAWSPDCRRLASASVDKTVKVWDAGTGQQQLTLKGHTNTVYGVTWSPDGTRLASASGGLFTGDPGEVKIWDAKTGQEGLSLQGHATRVRGLSWSPDGARLASASDDRTVRVWEAQTGQEAFTLRGHSDAVHGVAWSPDGARLASASEDRTVRVWDAQTGQQTLTLKGHTLGVNGVAWSPDGMRLASGSERVDEQTRQWFGEVKVWDATPRVP
jgi:WD40 repeat protein